MPQIPLKNAGHEARVIRQRLFIATGLVAILLLVVIVGLARLQIYRYNHFSTLSEDNRVRIEPIAPPRGLIFSRDGVVLAENQPSFSLVVVPERVHEIDTLIDELKLLVSLDQEDITRFKATLKRKRRFEKIPIRINLTEQEVAKFAVNRHRFPGVSIRAGLIRNYPEGSLTAHAVGYVGRISEQEINLIDTPNYSATDHIGKSGIEKAYEDALHGSVGYKQVEVNAQGRELREITKAPPLPGKDIYLTLDLGLQQEAAAALGGRQGAIVAIDPESGGLLALVSSPSYDPNLFVNGIDAASYQRLRESPARPLFNRALQGQYPPGSTIKPFLGLAALHFALRENEQEDWCPGWFSLPKSSHRYRDWKKNGHGHVDLRTAIVESCDVYFYRLAQDLGITRLHDFLAMFGLGKRTGVDIPGEASGLVPSAQWKQRARGESWYTGETVITGIGQGFMLATPLQLAMATATLGRHGAALHPRLAGQIEDTVSHAAQEVFSEEATVAPDLRPEHWVEVITAMRDVVHAPNGTARRAGAGAGYEFAGKTGTAQVFSISQGETVDDDELSEELKDHALFVAFSPVEQPVIAIAIIVEHGGGGSTTAAPIARRLLDYYFGETPTSAMVGG